MFRTGISAIIVNSKNEFLLVNLESFDHKYFALPGGGMEEGETLEDAAYREIHEELGIDKELLQYVRYSETPVLFKFKVITMNRDGKNYDGSERYFFGFRFIGTDANIKLKSGEVRSYKWVPFTKLKNFLLFEDQYEQTLEKIREVFPDIL